MYKWFTNLSFEKDHVYIIHLHIPDFERKAELFFHIILRITTYLNNAWNYTCNPKDKSFTTSCILQTSRQNPCKSHVSMYNYLTSYHLFSLLVQRHVIAYTSSSSSSSSGRSDFTSGERTSLLPMPLST